MQPAAPVPAIDFERLIELVRPFPYLYDRNEPEFKDVALKNHRWQLVGAEFGISGEHAAQKFRTMKTKYKDLKRMHEVARAHGRPVTRPRWRYYELMDDFMRGCEDGPRPSSGPVMVISNIYSVAEQSPAVATSESEAPIVPEVWTSEHSVSDGPEKKRIKQEPQYDEDVSWDTNDSVDDRVDGESLSSNQVQAQQHRAEATLENTADTSMASTSASPTGGSQQDAFHFFGMMVADRLRRLPRGAALRALNAMHQVLFEHEAEAGF